ncbi:LacI family transcriptional regulator [Jiangella aurantiaca]|uniref:LacI family transcriptional regulator n=1 Tax=Jiangella aurantiaca TaxID=2530373 RepID=A0A4R5AHS8_9ACTN|nr:LacI family transcriptional regulator [Jiangella aurantiaca]
MASIRQVAEHAGVSTATVARVLSGRITVSPELTERVRQAVDELNYVPNDVARSLSRGRTNMLGLLVSDIGNPFAAQVARGLEDEAARLGYQVLVGSSDFELERETRLLDSFAAKTVDAVALVSARGSTPAMARLARTGLPVVYIDRRPDGDTAAPLVRTDNETAARQAVGHLIELGHRDLAMISGPSWLPTASARLRGFRAACAEHGLTVRRECVREGHLGVEGGVRAMRDLLDLPERPTAVFSFNNLSAVGALRALRERGVTVPRDISLVTFDDMDLFPFVDPPITAIAQPAYEIGVEAGRTLLAMLSGAAVVPREVVLPTEFRIRSSCAEPPHREKV